MYRHGKENAKLAENNRFKRVFDVGGMAVFGRLICASCGRSLSKVVYRDHRGLPIGPTCAKLIGAYVAHGGLSAESSKAMSRKDKAVKKYSSNRLKAKRYSENQRDFFEEVTA